MRDREIEKKKKIRNSFSRKNENKTKKQKNKKINTQKLTNGNSGISKNNDKFPSFLVPFGYNFKRHECPCISIYVKQKKKEKSIKVSMKK